MVFVLIACASLLLGAAGVALASPMPSFQLTELPDPSGPNEGPHPDALARVYGRPVPESGELAFEDTVPFNPR